MPGEGQSGPGGCDQARWQRGGTGRGRCGTPACPLPEPGVPGACTDAAIVLCGAREVGSGRSPANPVRSGRKQPQRVASGSCPASHFPVLITGVAASVVFVLPARRAKALRCRGPRVLRRVLSGEPAPRIPVLRACPAGSRCRQAASPHIRPPRTPDPPIQRACRERARARVAVSGRGEPGTPPSVQPQRGLMRGVVDTVGGLVPVERAGQHFPPGLVGRDRGQREVKRQRQHPGPEAAMAGR
jgi:hypothetical protein